MVSDSMQAIAYRLIDARERIARGAVPLIPDAYDLIRDDAFQFAELVLEEDTDGPES